MAKSAWGNFDQTNTLTDKRLSWKDSFRKRKLRDGHTEKTEFIDIGKHFPYSTFIFLLLTFHK